MVTQQKKGVKKKVLPLDKVIHGFDGEKGGGGKSFVTKTQVQYAIDRNYPFTLVETDRSNPDVANVFKDIAKYAVFTEDLSQIHKADVIFEYAIEKPVILSLPSQVHRAMSSWIDHSSVLEIFKEYKITYCNWFVCNGRYDSVNLLIKSLEYYQDRVSHILVKNWGLCNDWSFLESNKKLEELIKEYKVKTIDFPKLEDREVYLIDQHCLNFGQARACKTLGVLGQQRVKNFLTKAYAAFDSTGLWYGNK